MKKKKRIVVFGSYITDLTARCERFPQAGETVFGRSFRYGPGGKGSNQAVAAHRAGADVVFITRVGCDYFGEYAREFYRSENMDNSAFICDAEHATGAALITVEDSSAQNEIVVIPGACGNFTQEDLRLAEKYLDGADVLTAQLEINMDAVIYMMDGAKRRGMTTVLNPAPACDLPDELLAATDVIIPNETEAMCITGMELKQDMSNVSALAAELRRRGADKVIITLGKHGYYAWDGLRECREPANEFFPVLDTTGAGDAFVGGFCAGLSSGMDFFESARFANVASSLAVTRQGTAPAMATEEEIWRYFVR